MVPCWSLVEVLPEVLEQENRWLQIPILFFSQFFQLENILPQFRLDCLITTLSALMALHKECFIISSTDK